MIYIGTLIRSRSRENSDASEVLSIPKHVKSDLSKARIFSLQKAQVISPRAERIDVSGIKRKRDLHPSNACGGYLASA